MKYNLLIISAMLCCLSCISQSIALPVIYKGEDFAMDTSKDVQLKPLLLKLPDVIQKGLISLTGRFFSLECLTHDPFSFVTITGIRKNDNTVALEFETMDEYTSHILSIERVFASGTENKEIIVPADSSFGLLCKMGKIGKFTSFKTMVPRNRGSIKAKYELTDQNNFAGISFYRITETGRDTTKNYSRIIAVLGRPIKETIEIFPNPAINQATINVFSKSTAKARLQLLNSQGVLINESAINIQAGTNRLAIPVSTLASGSYFIQVIRSESTVPLQTRFIKM